MAIENRQGHLVKALISLFAFAVCAAFAQEIFAQTDSADADKAFAQAVHLHESGDIEGAIRVYQTILASHPARVDARSNLGAAYSRLGRYEDAIEQYKRALAIDTRNQTIRFNLALAYYKATWFAEAESELSQFIAAAPKDNPQRQPAALLLADCQVRLGEYKKAIELLSPLAETNLSDRAIAYLLGSALVGDGQVKKGQVLIDRVFRDEDSAEARMLIGSILLLADDGQNAIKELERAIELNPKLPALHACYGRALMRMGDPEKAKLAFKNELADNPTDFDSNLYMGILLKRDRLLEESMSYLARAVRLRPRDSYARYHLGAVYASLGKPDEAQPLLEGVVKDYPEFVEARVLLASVYYRLNRKEDGNRERAIIQKLNAEQQAKQPGSQDAAQPGPIKSDSVKSSPVKPPADPENDETRRKERQ
jgi:tetratricopeptide (TPR) repeat protein